ncbi:DNA alkylation repair protein [Enterococcus cecorum]|uniref:DNA alkylation repair protein n=1 Tax=Enterococcus cecorum TaxID=44008 RepID=UPI000A91687F|nr:DNA alkylation repair protein [Enterococcus cecorum]MDZ5560998.1 DNA alkylation repair protein [Enterococcus cecorum]CAI3414605.1 DNA alkylation repair protein [Enterococcus cecorum]CAI3445975.1 DNA alkylation repair protein [Enterococcus cecorum]
MSKYETIKKFFESHSNPERAISMSKYMKDQFSFYGIAAADRKNLYKDFLKTEKKQDSIDWKFIDQCYADDHREFQYLAYEYLLAIKKQLSFEDISAVKGLVMAKSWWDTVDMLAQVVSNIALKDSRVEEEMLAWSWEENIWVQRIAILYQLRFKEKTNTAQLEQILLNCLGTNEFFINKAIGWSLREYSKTNPDWVRDFLEKYREQMANLSIREASKYLS